MARINQAKMSTTAGGVNALRDFKRFDTISTVTQSLEHGTRTVVKQVERQSSNDTMDRETSKIVQNTTRTIAPVVSVSGLVANTALSQAYKQQYIKTAKDLGFTGESLNKKLSSTHIKLEQSKNPNITYNKNGGLSTSIKFENVDVSFLNNGRKLKGIDFKNESANEFCFTDLKNDARSMNRILSVHEFELMQQSKLLNKELKTLERSEAYLTSAGREEIQRRTEKLQNLKREIKDTDRLRKLAKHTSDTTNKMVRLSSPRRFTKQILRIATTPVQNSEVMQGYRLLEASTIGAVAIYRLSNNVICAGTLKLYKITSVGKETYKNIKSGMGIKKAYSKAANSVTNTFTNKWGTAKVHVFGKDSASKLIRNHLSNQIKTSMIRRLPDVARRLNGKYAEQLVKDLENISNLYDTLSGAALSKDTINTAIRQNTKALTKNLINNTIGQTKPGKFAKDAIKGVKDVFAKPISKVKDVFGMFKTIWKNISDFIGKIGAVIAKITKILMSAIAVFFIFIMILYILDFFVRAVYQSNTRASSFFLGKVTDTIGNAFVDTNSGEWDNQLQERGEKIMRTLQNSHNDFLEEIENIRQNYDTTDTQYPSGSLENYKEIFCAVEVMCDFDFDIVTETELQGWVDKLYDQTHIITTEPYEFEYADGSIGNACHIYIDIQYDELLAYEAMAGFSTRLNGQVEIDAEHCPRGTVVNTDWMNIVRTVKTLIAQTQAVYDQTTYLPINVNDSIYQVRTDCSGYVSACLWLNGACTAGTNWNSQSLVNASSIPGFTKYSWNGWDNLQEGDIIAYGSYKWDEDVNGNQRYAWSGHTEIFSHNANGRHFVYSNGSTNTLRSAVPTSAGNHGYNATNTVVWRPNNAGSTNTEINVDGATDVETTDMFDPYIPFYSSDSIVLLFSNTSGVVFNEESGNEDGYETALKATVDAEMISSRFFLNNKFDTDSNVSCHTLNKDVPASYSTVSSYDFIRYIMAKHGVNTPVDYKNFGYISNTVPSVYDLKIGDIIFYVPKSTNAMTLSEAPNKYSIGSSGYDIIESEFVPMMYIGDGYVVAYSRNLHYEGTAYDNSTAQIRKYKLEDLESNRITETIRPNGYVIDSVYGQSGTFSGWTDTNIEAFIYLLRGTQWETGYAEYEDLIGNKTTVDYSGFYHEELFEGNIYISTTAHGRTFKNDILTVALKYYDQYGILPSTAYTHSYVVSKNRSTEESLLYFNIFEKYATDENGANETKFTYTSDGEAIANTYTYKKYRSYLEAYSDLYYTFVGAYSNVLFQESYTAQISGYANAGYLNNATRSKMTETYNSDKSNLDSWDANAVARKNAIDKLESKINTLQYATNTFTNNTSSEYYRLNKYISESVSAYNDLVNLLTSQDSATERTNQLIADADEIIEAGCSLAENKWQWYCNNRTHPSLFEYATCNGHTSYCIITSEADICNNCTVERVEGSGVFMSATCHGHTSYCWSGRTYSLNASYNCSDCDRVYETWYYGHCE